MKLRIREVFLPHVANHLPVCLALLAIVAAATITVVFPVYFRAEDADYLKWAQNNSPGAAFSPSGARLSGVFRPMQNLTWWALYHASGTDPFVYQFFTTLLYGLAFLFFFMVAELLFGFRAAVLSLIAHAAVFYWLGCIIFWFSDLTYIVEIFFANAAILVLTKAVRGKPRLFVPGAALYVCAALSKQPAVVIVPAVVALVAASEWSALDAGARRRALRVLGTMAAAGFAWLALNPSLRSRQGVEAAGRLLQAAALLLERWRFYAGFLMSGAGVLIWVCSLYLFFLPVFESRPSTAKRARVLSFATAVVLALMLRRSPAIALVALLASFAPAFARRRREAAAAAWFALPVLGVMTIAFALRTYLVECAFGIAMIMGAALDDMLAALLRLNLPAFLRRKQVAAACALIALCAGAAVAGPRVAGKVEALKLVSAQRLNFRDAVAFIKALPANGPMDLVVIDYRDMGLDNEKDILPLSDLEKARRQKTMESVHLQTFLGVIGADRIRVHTLDWLRTGQHEERPLLFVMNNFEEWYLGERASVRFNGQAIFSKTRGGETVRILRVSRLGRRIPPQGKPVARKGSA